MNTIKKLVVITLCLLFSGCYSPKVFKQEIADPNRGVVAFTLQCNSSNAMATNLFYSYEGTEHTTSLSPIYLTASCDGRRYPYTLFLDGGEEEFYLVTLMGMQYSYTAIDFKPIKFHVTPGKITYIGNLSIDSYDNHIFTFIKNDWINDLSVFQHRIPTVQGDKYLINIMQIDRSQPSANK